jgi:hypothetical protein
MFRTAIMGCLGAMLVLLAGCGASQARLLNDLKQTGLAYHNYHDVNQQGPSGWDELINFDKGIGGDGQAITRVRDAGYQLKWNARFSQVGSLAETVLAENPSGGPKLMMDGSVR